MKALICAGAIVLACVFAVTSAYLYVAFERITDACGALS